MSNFPNIVSDWIKFLKENKRYSENTIEAYISDIGFFISFLRSHFSDSYSEQTVFDISLSDFRAFLSYLTMERERSASSKARTVSTIKNFYKFLNKNYGQKKNEVVFLVKTPRFNKPLPRALDVSSTFNAIDEVNTIEMLKKNSSHWVAERDKTLLMLIYSCGLRISEALELKVSDFKNNFIRIKGKGNKERLVPLLDEVRNKVNSLIDICPYVKKSDPESYVFFGKHGKKLDPAVFQKVIKNIRNNLGLEEGVTPHSFRHSFATHLLSNSGDILSIQELLGHSNVSTTQRYTKIDKKRILESFSQFQ